MAFGTPPEPTHVPGTLRGEELVQKKGREPGRGERGSKYHRTSRDSTSINPKAHGPIDPRMPQIPPQ
jgi:hypothetical protein